MGKTTSEIEPFDAADRRDEEWPGSQAQNAAEDTTDADIEAAEIRSGIEQTRAEMSDTIDALQEKLDPARIAEQVKEQIRERATEAYDSAKESIRDATIGRAEKIMEDVSDKVSDVTQRAGAAVSDTGSWIVDVVRQNPVAFALIGAGLGALALNTRQKQWRPYRSSYDDGRGGYYGGSEYGGGYTRREAGGYYPDGGSRDWTAAERTRGGRTSESEADLSDKAREIADSVADTARAAKDRVASAVTSAAATVRETAGTVADSAREQVSYLSAEARYRARDASDLFSNTLQDNPLALGVAALAAGALVGLVLPPTRVEAEYMGEARDQFVDKAKAVARDTAEKVQRVTEEAGRTLKQEAERETQNTTTSEPAFPVKF